MGSAWSRGKKVAPESLIEVSASTGVSSSKHGAPFRPLKIHSLLRSARNRAQQDSPGEDSERSNEEEEDAQMETLRKVEAKRSTTSKSRTYGLCHFSSEDTEEEEEEDQQRRASTEPRGGRDVNTRGHARAVQIPKEHTSSSQTTLPRGTAVEAPVPTDKPWTCNGHPLLTMPVILYNGSEEELMDSIEREFS